MPTDIYLLSNEGRIVKLIKLPRTIMSLEEVTVSSIAESLFVSVK